MKVFSNGVGRVHLLGQGQQRLGFDPVDLVDGQCHAAALRLFGERLEDRIHPLGLAAMGFDQQDDDIGIRRASPGRGHHRPVQPAARAKEARRVDEDDLAVALHRDAADAGAGRLPPCGSRSRLSRRPCD